MTPTNCSKENHVKLIQHMNKILCNELTAINQYFLHARMMEHQGFATLGKIEYEESIDEMKHADMLTKKILFLGGTPNLQKLGTLSIGETVQEMLESDFQMEIDAIRDLKEAVAFADEINEYTVLDLLSEILHSEEEHFDWLRKQLGLIDSLGLSNYLQKIGV